MFYNIEVKKIEIYNLKDGVNFLKKDVAVREIIYQNTQK